MKVLETEIKGVLVVEPDVFRDARGTFCETYRESRYVEAGIAARFVQDNESVSSKGVLRGLHWQAGGMAQAKLLRVVRGAAWDVAEDIRKGSPTVGRYVAVTLSGENHRQFFIPRGFAHGFMALEDGTVFSYKCDNVYCREAERGMDFNDPALGIRWPEAFPNPTLSEKDRHHPPLKEIEPWEERA